MDGFSDLIVIIVLAVILLLAMEGSHRRRYRSGWYVCLIYCSEARSKAGNS